MLPAFLLSRPASVRRLIHTRTSIHLASLAAPCTHYQGWTSLKQPTQEANPEPSDNESHTIYACRDRTRAA